MSKKENAIQALLRQRELLNLEYNAEKEEFRRLTETMGIARKVKRGDCWYPSHCGRTYYNSLNSLVIEIFRDEDTEIEHNFEPGKQVMFFSVDGSDNLHYLKQGGTVSYAEENRMVISVNDPATADAIRNLERPGVQLSFDETTYKLMTGALEWVINAKGNRLAEIRDTLYGWRPTARLQLSPMEFPWLNASQQTAVNSVLAAKDVSVVHGPPGTGKTTTLVEAIYETLRRENQVLVCAQSNMAVDWISEQLCNRGIDVLRVGNPARVTDRMLALTYERRYEAHPDYPQLWALRKTLREVQANRKRGEAVHQKMDRLKSRITELEIRIHNTLMGEARVIACTLAGSASRVLEGTRFGTLFIDEAAQALEAACWIAIRKADRVILAGDHCQLPPTVKSIEAIKGRLDKTLMERIVENNPQTVTLLQVQYRMNEDIMRFSSDWFYDGKVRCASEVHSRGILDLDTAITWVNTEGEYREEFVGESFGRINRDEAALTLATLQTYFERIGRERIEEERIDVGIISPYRAQVQYLRRLLKRSTYFKPLRKFITVNTVDGFQGQERDVIMISLVRSNDDGQIGFLRDLRRMNVAMTRARMKLFVLGDATTMTRHPFYKKLYNYISKLNGNDEQTD